ncbi:extracellular solute-binding protein [Microlunatus elymi]|uniref:Extracellular solute-binding protein n=1 Tax=Microlunatus elymi TaxID=2596828 RepID=A0A516PZX5_9ACTN|nr:extracellular solute-binding protein [Microlunatus elymi]QDP96720.1 extracellular solute-binding protein [Microlunatus elymi]
MNPHGNLSRRQLLAGIGATTALGLAGCSAGSLGSSDSGGNSNAKVTLKWQVGNTEDGIASAKNVVKHFTAKHPDIAITLDPVPGGTEGDNLVKTRLSTGSMDDVFGYNSGSLFHAIDPVKNLVPISDQSYVSQLEKTFVSVVTEQGKVYGVPAASAQGGGILYSKPVYEKLGLEVPKTWDDFIENCKKVKSDAKEVAPILQTYGTDWTAQLFVLADYHNVQAQDAEWPTKYTKNQVHYAQEPALAGWMHLQQTHDLKLFNSDFASATYDDGLKMIANGQGAHYPMLSQAVSGIAATYPNKIDDIGFFAQPGQDAAKVGLTGWLPNAVYIPTSTKGDKLEAAKKFLAFLASPDGCAAFGDYSPPSGPYAVDGCALPDAVPQAIKDVAAYFDDAKVTPALEFVSPIKGPAMPALCVEVGSGIKSGKQGAQLYDQDVKKQAQQLGLPGW